MFKRGICRILPKYQLLRCYDQGPVNQAYSRTQRRLKPRQFMQNWRLRGMPVEAWWRCVIAAVPEERY